ncbi:MAG: PhnD/SsuA/transferrin family substrate-binding protein [Pseudomonadota bacterium]
MTIQTASSPVNNSSGKNHRLFFAVTLLLCLITIGLIQSVLAQDNAAETTAELQPENEPVENETDLLQWQLEPIQLLVNPIYLPEQAERVYQPLADYLSEETDLNIQLVTARNFHRYWLDARRDESAPLVLEDSHMASWRMNELGYEPLVTTSVPTSFSLLAMGQYADYESSDFIGLRISTLPSPSLGFVILSSWYTNPFQQPAILSNATSWLDAIEIVFAGEAEAAIVPQNLVLRYPNLYVIRQSEELPGLTLSAASNVPQSIRQTLTEAMLRLHENADYHAALFELDIEQFVQANPEDYTTLDAWLNSIFAL